MIKNKLFSLSLLSLAGVAVFVADLPSADARVVVRPRYGYRGRMPGTAVAPFGWYGGVGLAFSKILAQSGGPELLEDGFGWTLYGGLHVNRMLSVELGFVSTYHNPITIEYGQVDHLVLDGLSVDVKLHFDQASEGQPRTLVPFAQGGLGLYALSSQAFGLDSVGTGFQLGGGFDYWLNAMWAFELRALYRGISMGPPNGGADDTFVSAVTIEASIGVHF